MKRLYLACLVLTIITAVSAKLLLADNPSHPVFAATTYDEFVNASLDIPVMSFGFDPESDAAYLLENEDQIFQFLDGHTGAFHSEVNILVVEAESGFRQYTASYTQDVTGKEVVKGDAGLNEKKIRIANHFGMVAEENLRPVFAPPQGRNIMIPGHRYLAFCEKTEIADYEDIPSYRMLPQLCCFDLSSDYSVVTDGKDCTYRTFVGSEFCVNYPKILDALLIIKHDILEKYYHN